MAKNKSVFGIYSSRSGVEYAVTALKDAGFQHSDVSVLLPENLGNREISTGYLQLKINGVTRLIADYEASGTEGSAGFPHHRRRTAFCDRI